MGGFTICRESGIINVISNQIMGIVLMKNIVLSVTMAVAVVSGLTSFAVTDLEWTGAGGDMDLTNPANWSGSTLPSSPDYSAKLKAASEESPYTMLKATSLQSYSITLTDGLTLDLGKGNSFLAPYRVNINTTDKTYNLKSGTFGVDWSSTSGERFFMGNNSGSSGNTFNVSGEDSVLMGSYQSTIQVGTNQGRQRLNVSDGATMKANVIVGSNEGCHSNVAWIANARHIIMSDSKTTPLTVGALGGWNAYVLTNGASFANAYVANIYMPSSINHGRGTGHNRIVVTDHSDFSTAGTLDIGYCADDNGMILENGSTLACKILNLASETDSGKHVVGNFVHASGSGTTIRSTSNTTVGGRSTDTKLWLNDGAEMFVDDTLMFGGSGASTNMFAYFGTNTILDVKNGFQVCACKTDDWSLYSDIVNAHLVVDGGSFYYTNTVNTGRTATIGGNGTSNGMEFANGAYGRFSSPGGTVQINVAPSARGGYLKVRDSGTLVQFFDQNIYFGSEAGSQSGYFLIDGGTVAITNVLSRKYFRIGSKGSNNLMEVTNGGCLTFSNLNFEVCGGGESAVSNVLRIANGGRVEGHVTSSVADGIIIGYYGVGGLDVDGGILRSPQILRVSHTVANAGGSWVRIRNGGYVEVNRVIMGESTQGNRISIDNGTLRTLGDSIQLGTNDSRCMDDGLYITGTNAFVRSGSSISLSPKSFVQFDIGRHGLCTTGAVVTVQSNFGVTTPVTEENPVAVRITDDDPERIKGGTYTLIEAKNGKIDWSKIKVECPDTVRIVEKTEKKLVVRAKSNEGLLLILR